MSAVQVAGRRGPWPLVVIAGGGIAGLAIGFVLSAVNDTPDAWQGATALGLLSLLFTILVVGVWWSIRPYSLRRHVPIAPEAIHDHAQLWFGRARWALTRSEPDELVFWRRTESSTGLVIVLLLLGVIPGILYYFWTHGTQTIAIGLAPVPGGTDLLILVHPRGSDGRNRVVNFYNSLQELVDG